MTSQRTRPVIAIMRPERYLEESAKLAEDMGFEPILVPMVQLIEKESEYFDGFVTRVIDGLSDYVIFTSANGIIFTLNQIELSQKKKFIDALNSTKVIAIGPNTKKELEVNGIKIHSIPDVYSTHGLLDHLCNKVSGKNIEIPRSLYGAPELVTGLKSCGANVHEIHVYTLQMLEGEKQKQLINSAIRGEISAFAFTSSMMVHSFFKLSEKMGHNETIVDALNNSIVASIGAPTAKTLESYNIVVDVIPENYVYREILIKIKQYIGIKN